MSNPWDTMEQTLIGGEFENTAQAKRNSNVVKSQQGFDLLDNKITTNTSNIGILQGQVIRASSTEYFDKDNTKIITANDVANDVRLSGYSVIQESDTSGSPPRPPVGNPFATGGSFVTGYNLLTTFTTANENKFGGANTVYRDVTNNVQNTFLAEDPTPANNKLLFPSSLHTYNEGYVSYSIRVNIKATAAGTFAGNNGHYYVRVIRFGLNTIARNYGAFIVSDSSNGDRILVPTMTLNTFVDSESDPFVNGGIVIDIIKDVDSTDPANININYIDITISKD
jgi:hypothetical protein